jgi:ABC-type bacteriocin/lantibiotic exporter with double-glycine peptidase domain
MQFVVDQVDIEESLSSKQLLLAVKMIVVLMNVTFARLRERLP